MATVSEMLEAIETATSIAPRNGGLELDDWEEGFVNSITERVDNEKSLSERQIESLTKIWDKT